MMTNASTNLKDVSRRFAPGSSRTPRSVVTFQAQMAKTMEAARRAEMAERIRELRGPRPQPVIADRAGVRLRTYQMWEAGDSVPGWDNLTALANVHGVTEDWILYGDDALPDTPPVAVTQDDLQALRADVSALREDVAQITGLLTQLLDPLAGLLQAQEQVAQRAAELEPARRPRRAARGGQRKAS